MITQVQKNLRGIAAMCFAMACFSVNDALVKLARQEWPTSEVMVLRGLFSIALLTIWLLVVRETRQVPMLFSRMMLFRAVLEGAIASAFITAIGLMAYADVTAMLMAAPLLITALSMVFYGEKVGWRRWLAILIGFGGMMLVVKPGGGGGSTLALGLTLASVLGVAVRDLTTRRIQASMPTIIVALASTLGTFAAGLVLAVVGPDWTMITARGLGLVAGAAVFVIIGNYMIVAACRDVELSVVSPFRFSIIIWAVGLGFLVFGEWPSPVTFLGMGLIAASGLYTLHRERVRQKSQQ